MRTKHITALVTFAITFAVSVTVAGMVKSFQGLSTAEKITNVLSQDISNGYSRRTNYSNPAFELAQRTNEYVEASESLNTNDLPEDFQVAWQKHMQAWRNHANFLNRVRFSTDCDKVDLNYIDSKNTGEINRTWWEVLRIARKNGAVIPNGAYN